MGGPRVKIETVITELSDKINNPNNSIRLDAQTFHKIWIEMIPILDQYKSLDGDFRIGGYLYSELKHEMACVTDRIARNSRRIEMIISDLQGIVTQTKY
jgi:hypothetical protein